MPYEFNYIKYATNKKCIDVRIPIIHEYLFSLIKSMYCTSCEVDEVNWLSCCLPMELTITHTYIWSSRTNEGFVARREMKWTRKGCDNYCFGKFKFIPRIPRRSIRLEDLGRALFPEIAGRGGHCQFLDEFVHQVRFPTHLTNWTSLYFQRKIYFHASGLRNLCKANIDVDNFHYVILLSVVEVQRVKTFHKFRNNPHDCKSQIWLTTLTLWYISWF